MDEKIADGIKKDVERVKLLNVTKMKKKINIITLGCSKNVVDSEHLAGQLVGWEVIFDSDEVCDVVVINTCGFILDAKQESIDTILNAAELKKSGQIKHLFVIGCLSERYKDQLKEEIEEVDQFFGVTDFYDVLKLIGAGYSPELAAQRKLSTPKHYAYLKIGEGCNWGCGYCAIPLIRGTHKSVPMETLICEAQELAKKGVKELMVIAQDTTYYGLDLYGERKLGTLLKELCKIDGIDLIRLHYAYPAQFPQDVIDVLATEPKMCKYLDIPFQHISNDMLKSMRRGLNKEETYDLIRKLRTQIPEIAIRTTLLVGYPNETEQDFEELKQFVMDAKFERLGVFPYSEEEGTYSALNLTDNVPEETKQLRADQIMELQQQISLQNNISRVDKTVRAIIDRKEDDLYVGRSDWDSPEVDGEIFIVTNNKLKPGQIINAQITKADIYDLYGREI